MTHCPPPSPLTLLAACLLGLAPPATGWAQPSPAEQMIQAAHQAIHQHPARPEAYNALALAQARRARESADPAWYGQALKTLEQSLKLAPDNYEARRNRVWVLLGQHQFAQALAEAQALNQRMPDDLMTYAYLTDAHVELGHYREAETAAQWLLDLRPGNIPGLTRAAYLRELFGDVEGAIELMRQAYQRTPPSESEDRAWVLTQLAHLELQAGRVADAEGLVDEALKLFPGYHYALAQLARVREAQGRPGDALDAWRRHYAAAPQPENLYPLARALERQGLGQEARAAYAEFEARARAESPAWDNANRELIFYYADQAGRAAEALALAEQEYARRQDAHTLDAYAWALYRNGRLAEARRIIDQAVSVGLRDPRLLYHAGAIALEQRDRPTARRHLKQSLELAPWAETAEAARLALAGIAE